MTTALHGPQERQREHGTSSDTWEERFPRYAGNAGLTARYATQYADRQRKAAGLHANAAAYARQHGDPAGANLYEQMAEAALDAADALEDIATLARQVAGHYTELARQENPSS